GNQRQINVAATPCCSRCNGLPPYTITGKTRATHVTSLKCAISARRQTGLRLKRDLSRSHFIIVSATQLQKLFVAVGTYPHFRSDGVQIAIMANIFIQLLLIVLSLCLFIGIIKERPGLIIPWIIGLITFMALEAVCIVYSNVLRDHINKQFDALCRAEVAFFIARGVLNILALVGVVRYYQDLLCGISWKEPEAFQV
uniref:MARVEL domain-containing protein n=1 Tax=Strigamia maritima TaxID=126957 RepID=T1JAA2_STRMM